jgi:hypothetical protein
MIYPSVVCPRCKIEVKQERNDIPPHIPEKCECGEELFFELLRKLYQKIGDGCGSLFER